MSGIEVRGGPGVPVVYEPDLQSQYFLVSYGRSNGSHASVVLICERAMPRRDTAVNFNGTAWTAVAMPLRFVRLMLPEPCLARFSTVRHRMSFLVTSGKERESVQAPALRLLLRTEKSKGAIRHPGLWVTEREYRSCHG